MDDQTQAVLGSNSNYTIFSFGGHVIGFIISAYIEQCAKIKIWDNNYLATRAKFNSFT